MSSSTQEPSPERRAEIENAHHILYEEGIRMRKAVVGDAYVTRSLENAQAGSGFSVALQDYATVYLPIRPAARFVVDVQD